VLSLLSLAFCYAGFAMAASFTVSNPESLAHWQRMAKVYLGLCGLSIVGIAFALVILVRRSRRRVDAIAPAS
jgi:mannose/fructose/N-acetylgalactosamine-specific phosphotransferase system component IIC